MKKIIPIVKPPVVDRLAFILPWGINALDDQAKLLPPIQRRIASAINAGRCERVYAKGARYRESFHINLNGDSPAFVQIGALRPQHQKGGIRVVLNPAHFASDDAALFNRVMNKIIGDEYLELMKHPLINNADFATDIVYARLDKMLVGYSYAQRCTVFAKRINANGSIEGFNFGSVTSDYMTVVYAKCIERVHAAILELVKSGVNVESLKSNAVKQILNLKDGPDTVRVEVRGKKMRGLHLYELNALPNRFARFSFADLSASGETLPKFVELAFHALCHESGVKAALTAFKHTEHARAVNKYWRTRQADWWQPELLWQQACEAVRQIGLFPDEAFVSSL
jgi:hypothetical protein